MKRTTLNEKGIALVVSVVALVVMGALVTAAFAPTYLEQKVAENTRRAGVAFEAAEYGVGEITGAWNITVFNQLPPGDTATWSRALPGGMGTADAQVRRLNNEMFLVDITGSDRAGLARQKVGQLYRLKFLDMEISAALTTRGAATIGGSAQISGADYDPVGWPECGSMPDTTLAGIRMPDTTALDFVGASCSGGACVNGAPSVHEDSTVTDSTFFEYGDLNWNDLVAAATNQVPAGTYQINPVLTPDGLSCDISAVQNWGDPFTVASPCFGYFPITYVPGNLSVNSGVGQGILLVEGDLNVSGGFDFFGITIVKGRLRTQGTGGHFNGAVLAANVDLDDITVLGDALVQFSTCAVVRALRASSPARPLNSRGWLYTM